LSRIDGLIRKERRFQVEFSRVKKSEDLTEGFNLSRGKGKLSDAALHYIAFRLRTMVATGFVLSPHSVLLLAQRADVIKLHN
jgi:hypothetical protein